MSVLDALAKQASRLAGDVQVSLKRARVEGERRLLQRQHRAALEELGERAYELVRSGELPEDPLGPEIAAVESKLIEIEAKAAEIETLRGEDAEEEGPEDAEDPSRTAFPMVDEEPAEGASEAPPSGQRTGWEAADRFFKRDS